MTDNPECPGPGACVDWNATARETLRFMQEAHGRNKGVVLTPAQLHSLVGFGPLSVPVNPQ